MLSHSDQRVDAVRALEVYCIVCEAGQGEPCQIRPFGVICEPHNARRRDARNAVEFSTTAPEAVVSAIAAVENRRAPDDDDQLCRPGRSAQLDFNTVPVA